jgi:flavin-binding protein dodecin
MSTSTKTQSPLAHLKALRDRLDKAEELVRELKVHQVIDMRGHYVVEGEKGHYIVNDSCLCLDFLHCTELVDGYCKHKLAALLYEEQVKGPNYDPELERKIQELYS